MIKKLGFVTLLALTILAALTAGTVLAAAPTVTAGAPDFAANGQLIAARWRSFANTGGDEMYLGIPDLGVAGNRVAANFTWPSGATNRVSFTFDPANDKLRATVDLGNNGSEDIVREYIGLAAQWVAKGKAFTTSDLNAMEIIVASRDANSEVRFEDVTLDGLPLGSFTGAGFNTWSVTGFDFSQGFTLSGLIKLSGPFSGSQENSRVEIKVGHVLPRTADLTVRKVVNWGSLPADPNARFTVCVTGGGLPADGVCEDLAGGESFTVPGLPIGDVFTVAETDPGADWTVTNREVNVTIAAEGSAVEITNTYTPRGVCPQFSLPEARVWQDGDRSDTITLLSGGPVRYQIQGFFTNPDAPDFYQSVTATPGFTGTLSSGQSITLTYPLNWGSPNEHGAREVHVVVHMDGPCGYVGHNWDRWYHFGRLDVTKVVDWANALVDEFHTFELCISGPSYPNGNCQLFDYDGETLRWDDLIPGTYTVTETNPGPDWTVSGSGVSVVVYPSWVASTATVTNTHVTVCPRFESLPATVVFNPGDVDVIRLIEGGPVNYRIEGFYTNPNAPAFAYNGATGTLNNSDEIVITYPDDWGDFNQHGAYEVHVVIHMEGPCGYIGHNWDRWYHDAVHNDQDTDGIVDEWDNCPTIYNPEQDPSVCAVPEPIIEEQIVTEEVPVVEELPVEQPPATEG